MDTDPAMVRYSNITLNNLIAIAYRYDSNLIVIPERFGGGSYDVAARLPAAASKDKVPEMMQTLLAERFKLVVHRESKDEKVYYLTIARNGPKLKPARPEGGPNSITLNGIFGRAMPISMLAASLTRPLEGTRVIDKTGLEGQLRYRTAIRASEQQGTRTRRRSRAARATRAKAGGREIAYRKDCR